MNALSTKNLEKTFKAIRTEFSGPSNAGLRLKLRNAAVAIIQGDHLRTDLLFVAESVALTASGKAKLDSVNAVFLAESSNG